MTYTINGKAYPVSGFVRDRGGALLKSPSGDPIPVVDIPMMSDVKWQRRALEERLRYPENYARFLGEDVPAVCDKLRAWLSENDPEWKEGDL